MTVIAMTREMGSRGKDVALSVADRLGLNIIHHEIVEKSLADRMQLSASSVHRFLEGDASLWERWRIDGQRLSRYSATEILELVAQGNVLIRGWGAAQLLAGIGHVVSIRVCAPMRAREQEMMRRLALQDRRMARTEIRRSDAAHESLIRNRFNIDWQDPTGYALTVNTADLPIEICTDLICEIARSPAHAETEDSRRQVNDLLVTERVRATIEEHGDLRAVSGAMDVSTVDGVVTLRCLIPVGADPDALVGRIRALPGVRSVVNEMHHIPLGYAAFGP